MIPKLKIIQVSNILPLTDYNDDKVTYLTEAIEKSNSIRNPVAVTPAGDHKYLLLEDASILKAADQLGVGCLPAQVIFRGSSPLIEVKIYIEDLNKALLDKFIQIFPRTFSVCHDDDKPKSYSNCLKIIVLKMDDQDIVLYFKKNGMNKLTALVFNFLKFLGLHCKFPSRISTDFIKNSSHISYKKYSLLEIPGITIKDLRQAANYHYKFPAGFLKCEFKNRLIGINYPVTVLNENAPAKEKEKFLYDLVNFRLHHGHPEFIRSGVYLLNY